MAPNGRKFRRSEAGTKMGHLILGAFIPGNSGAGQEGLESGGLDYPAQEHVPGSVDRNRGRLPS